MMSHFGFVTLASLAALVPTVLAQASAYGQCGGIGWSGATTCVSGYTCTYSNDWYSQCIPGTATTTATTTVATTTQSSTTSAPSSTSTSASGPSYWFSFGDSYTDTGFKISGTQPSIGNPLGNPAYPGQTITGGPTWIDVATTVSNHSTILTWNFAISGSVVDKSLTGTYGSTLIDQVSTFSSWNSGSNKKPWTGSNTIFSFWFGINDIGLSISTVKPSSPSSLDSQIISQYMKQVTNLYNLGARNFLFNNVPPFDRSPQYGLNNAAVKSQIADFNTQLASAVASFKSSHSGVQTWIWDSNAYFTKVLNSPQSYGFKDATSTGSGSQYFWGNALHPSGAAHTLFGKEVGNLLAGTPF